MGKMTGQQKHSSVQAPQREQLKSRMAKGTNDFLSLSVRDGSDNSLSLKELLCLEMVLCRGWWGLSKMDKNLVRVLRSATDVRKSSSAPTMEPYVCNQIIPDNVTVI